MVRRHGRPDPWLGLLTGEDAIDVHAVTDAMAGPASAWPQGADVVAALCGGEEMIAHLAQVLAWSQDHAVGRYPVADCELACPVPDTRPVLCVGLNYRGAAQAVDFRPGEGPPVFLKAPTTLVGAGDAIVLPRDAGPVRAEVELGVVIGRTARHLPADRALDVVAGYTIVLDVTAQDMMDRDAYSFTPQGAGQAHRHIVMFRAKNYDTFTPVGPAVVTRDEVPDERLGDLRVRGWLNEVPYTDGSTADLLLDVPHLIEHLSSVLTLRPGDLIATGHPGFAGPSTLSAGDLVTAEIDGVGRLSVRVIDEGGPAPDDRTCEEV